MAVFFFTFSIAGLAALVFPYLRPEMYNASPIAKYKVGPIPLISIAGLITVVFSLYTGWVNLTAPSLGVSTDIQRLMPVIIFVLGFVVFYAAVFYRRSQGSNVDLVFKEILQTDGRGMAVDDEVNPLACSTLAYAGLSLEAALDGIAGAGYRHVEIAAMPGYCDHLVEPGETESETVRRVGDAVHRAGLHAISLSAHIDLVCAPPGHLPEYDARQAIEMLLARVRVAAALGATVVNTQGANPQGAADEDAFVTRIEVVAEEARRVGVVLALEVADGLTASAESIQSLHGTAPGSSGAHQLRHRQSPLLQRPRPDRRVQPD